MHYFQGPLKEAGALKKKVDAARLEYDSAQRALQKKNDSLHQDEFNNAERKFQESKEVRTHICLINPRELLLCLSAIQSKNGRDTRI